MLCLAPDLNSPVGDYELTYKKTQQDCVYRVGLTNKRPFRFPEHKDIMIVGLLKSSKHLSNNKHGLMIPNINERPMMNCVCGSQNRQT